jgi:hypothetical protein
VFKEKYYQSKKVHEIMNILSCKVMIELEKIYIQIAWHLYKQYGNAFLAFKEALK